MATEEANNVEHYIVVFIYSKHKYYFIWKSDENDVFLTQNDKIIFWHDIYSLKKFCEINDINFADEKEIVYNIDCCENWCNSMAEKIDCSTILNLWNIFSDLHSSIGVEFEGSLEYYNAVYDKLFYGNNLPCVNSTSEKYLPNFNRAELLKIKEVMMRGIELFRKIISL